MGHPGCGDPGASGAARRGWAGGGFVFAGVVHVVGELLEVGCGGAQGCGAVAANLGHDLLVEVVDEAAEIFFGTAGGVAEAILQRLLIGGLVRS